MIDYTFHWRPVWQALPQLVDGALVSLAIAALSMVIGVCIAILLALFKRSSKMPLKSIANVWIEVARNTPALFQIYMVYFGLGSIGIYIDSGVALLVGIAFNNAGYLAETFRGGLEAIPHTQLRAARSLGMKHWQAVRLILLPQMFRIVFPATTNQMVWAILMTSLGVVVGMTSDLAGVTQELNVRTFRTFEYFIVAAAIYYAMAKLFTASARLLSWRLFRY
jgi:His/Glu/Gln/Arg/opine family amino acid ABC transporter permease subunit